ncbi:MAG: hypothetical protein HY721_03230 [Planctomycetes bacterium]|nr:hypothetical protein [Planctomycetota bacterium]
MIRSRLLAIPFVCLLASASFPLAAGEVSLAADILPGSSGSFPSYLTVHGEHLYFRANSAAGGTNVTLPTLWRLRPETAFRRGDANADGAVDVSDAVAILLYRFGGASSAVLCSRSADSDDSGEVDLADAVALLQALFLGAAPPPEPSAACGLDPTRDELTCERHPACE